MNELLRPIFSLGGSPRDAVVQVIDILLVSFLVYRLLAMIRGGRAWRIIMGIFIFLLLLFASKQLGLHAVHWVLDKATVLGPVALVILLLPELRQALEGFGKIGGWSSRMAGFEPRSAAHTVDEVVAAATELAGRSVGALIVIERSTPIDDIAENGVSLDAKVSAPLLMSLFYVGNPLHDGAVVIQGDRLSAAACRLPLSESSRLAPNLHLRHRAAVGITEQRDCAAVVVSEERGAISYVLDGVLKKVSPHELRALLNRDLRGEETDRPTGNRIWPLGKTKEKKVGSQVP